MVKASIYSVLALCFMTITLYLMVSGVLAPGFNIVVMIVISGLMSLILLSASWVLWKEATIRSEVDSPKQLKEIGVERFFKVVIASYGVAIALTIVSIVGGLCILGYELADKYLIENMGAVLLGITILSLPVVNKYLR